MQVPVCLLYCLSCSTKHLTQSPNLRFSAWFLCFYSYYHFMDYKWCARVADLPQMTCSIVLVADFLMVQLCNFESHRFIMRPPWNLGGTTHSFMENLCPQGIQVIRRLQRPISHQQHHRLSAATHPLQHLLSHNLHLCCRSLYQLKEYPWMPCMYLGYQHIILVKDKHYILNCLSRSCCLLYKSEALVNDVPIFFGPLAFSINSTLIWIRWYELVGNTWCLPWVQPWSITGQLGDKVFHGQWAEQGWIH